MEEDKKNKKPVDTEASSKAEEKKKEEDKNLPKVVAEEKTSVARIKEKLPKDITKENIKKNLSLTTMSERMEGSEKVQNSLVKMDDFYHFMTDTEYETDNAALDTARGPIRMGMYAFLFVFVFLLGWGALAPIDSAAIATGSVVLDANRKTIQHLEGGIIAEILVREGDTVEKGQPLLRLSETNARARQEILTNQRRAAIANEARLVAERDGKDFIEFPKELLVNQDNPDTKELLEGQVQLFDSRRKAVTGQVNIIAQRVNQLKDEIDGLKAQERGTSEQMALIEEEVKTVAKLVEKGQGLKPRLLALKREASSLKGKRGEYLSLIARAEQSIGENKLQSFNVKNESQREVVDSLRQLQEKVADVTERLRASQDILERIIIAAPQAGVVTDLRFHTIGGVIPPGQKILDIIPQDDKLVVEAQVDPRDIDIVHPGLSARVRLSAYKVRFVPPLQGIVHHVSPDKFIDQATGRSFYVARILVDQRQLEELENVELYPGMPADVLIVTGERTFLSYLFDPITGSFNKAFREQ
jgi:HlyD family type I secretion membrane fusion protein